MLRYNSSATRLRATEEELRPKWREREEESISGDSFARDQRAGNERACGAKGDVDANVNGSSQ